MYCPRSCASPTVPSTVTPVQSINWTANRKCMVSDEPENNIIYDHDYLPSMDGLSDVSACIAVYVAGFVVRHLELKLKCEACVSAL